MIDPFNTPEARERWTQLHSGERNYRFDPMRTKVRRDDIAWHLAQKCRFGGATRFHYSVARHALAVCALVAAEHPDDLLLQYKALHHDSAEAYIDDLEGPYKALPQFGWHRRLDSKTTAHVWTALGIDSLPPYFDADGFEIENWWMTAPIDKADRIMLVAEALALLPPDPYWDDRLKACAGRGWVVPALQLEPVPPELTYIDFLHRDNALRAKLGLGFIP